MRLLVYAFVLVLIVLLFGYVVATAIQNALR